MLSYPLREQTARERGEVVLDRAFNGTRARIDGCLRIGLIGAGVFAKAVILPALKRIPNAAITAVATASGINAREAAAAFGAAYASTEYRRILADPEIDAVIALTRHDSHAAIVAEALRQGKPVFVEKPLCLDRESLATLSGEYQQAHERAARGGGMRPLVMVGFNRRFSPHALRLRDEIAQRQTILIQYRVNAGALPATSWMHDRRIGGGRLIGEACHFIDLMQFIAGREPSRVFCEALPADERSPAENFLLTVRFGDGSAGTLTYCALGDSSAGKERIELYYGQRLYVIEDFKKLTAFAERRRRTLVNRSDKGHERELASFIEAVRSGSEPVPFDSYVATTLTTFAALDSISSREPVDIASAWPAKPLDAQQYGDRGV